MPINLGVVMDSIATIHYDKDSTLAMLRAAQARAWPLYYFESQDLVLRDGRVYGAARMLHLFDQRSAWFTLSDPLEIPLDTLDIILMRKDPPLTLEYLYTTHLLEFAARAGVLVANRPSALREVNEKLYALQFAQCCPPTLVTADMRKIRAFLAEQGDIILKPLDAMGGSGIYRLRPHDANLAVILETATERGKKTMMAQRYIVEVRDGDKRILLINGEPVPYALARIPAPGETRANLAAGGRGVGVPLTAQDRWICGQIGPDLRARGIWFAGIDVIGSYLTEINVTSPTGVRELDKTFKLDIAGQLLDTLKDLHAQRYLQA
jgi:glutathione synthase